MSDIIVNLPDNLGTVRFPADTSPDVIERESANAYLRARGTSKGKADAAMGRDRGTSQAFANGALQGLGDELTAGVRAALPKFSDWMMKTPQTAFGATPDAEGFVTPTSPQSQTVSDAPTFGGRYEEELARERAKKAAFSQENPILSGTATVAGAMAPMVLAGMTGIPTAPAMTGSTLGNVLKAGATGAGYGGLFGFNEGEGGFENRLDSGGEAAAVGAVLGPAFYGLGKGAGALSDYAKTTKPGQAVLGGIQKGADWLDRLGSVKPQSLSAAAPEGYVPGNNPATYAADSIRSSLPTPQDALKDRAISFIASAVERGKMTPQQAQAGLDKLGAGATLADVNKNLFRITRMTNTLPGETSDLAERVLTDRARTYNPTLRSSIEGGNASLPEDFFFRGDVKPGGNILDQTAREVGKRVYAGMDDAGLKQSARMLKIMENPQIEGAMDRVLSSLKSARVGTDRAPESPVQVMHMIKREIQNIGLDANGRPSSTAFQWQQTADDFVSALKQANPELAKADIAYAKVKSLPDFYESGLGTFGKANTGQAGLEKSAAAIENMMKTADLMQSNALQFGAVNAGRARTGGNVADAVSFARTINESEEVRRKIVSAFGENRAQEIFNAAQSVSRFNKTAQGILGGSQSTDKAAEALMGGAADLGNAGVRVTPSGMVPRFFQTATDILQRVAAPNEATRNTMGALLLNPEAGVNAKTLELVGEYLRRASMQRQGAAIAGGVSAVPFGLGGP